MNREVDHELVMAELEAMITPPALVVVRGKPMSLHDKYNLYEGKKNNKGEWISPIPIIEVMDAS